MRTPTPPTAINNAATKLISLQGTKRPRNNLSAKSFSAMAHGVRNGLPLYSRHDTRDTRIAPLVAQEAVAFLRSIGLRTRLLGPMRGRGDLRLPLRCIVGRGKRRRRWM